MNTPPREPPTCAEVMSRNDALYNAHVDDRQGPVDLATRYADLLDIAIRGLADVAGSSDRPPTVSSPKKIARRTLERLIEKLDEDPSTWHDDEDEEENPK
jgi:hypothetical protein